jgi:hypothetical protein
VWRCWTDSDYAELGPTFIAEYCERYAKLEDIGRRAEEDTSDGEVSEDEEYMSSDEEMAGHADPWGSCFCGSSFSISSLLVLSTPDSVNPGEGNAALLLVWHPFGWLESWAERSWG